MLQKKKILAVIPVRGGSKGLPGKNVKPLCGKPLMAWTIEQAKNSGILDEIVVSTDSPDLAAVSAQYGLPVPFMRPEELATDEAASVDVILHALDFYEQHGRFFDYVALLQVTSPLRDPEDIVKAYTELSEHPTARSIVSVGLCERQHPAFLVTRAENGSLQPLGENTDRGIIPALRRQDIGEVYFFDGSLYISSVGTLRQLKSFFHAWTIPYINEKSKTYEIDDTIDFKIVECIMRNRTIKGKFI